MLGQSIYHTYKRYRTLQTHVITALPIVILMPHSACNCRCVMCDIWKGNKNVKQLNESDIKGLLDAFKKYSTRQVVMSGGEALLNPNFFRFCEILQKQNIAITLLSTGLLLKKNAVPLVQLVDDIIVSLDGDEQTHDAIRNIKGAYQKLKEGIQYIKNIHPLYRITARTVIHKLNFKKWQSIVGAAKEIDVDQISFLPADVSSQAFNREILWDGNRQQQIALSVSELPELKSIIDEFIEDNQPYFANHFIAETPEKIYKIYTYYSALHGLCNFPYKQCNAPWVSTVIEADGAVKPCFFHAAIGNIKSSSLPDILNSAKAKAFRKNLDIDTNNTCKQCVCYLNLPAWINPVHRA